ncbi:MAG: DUF4178 domain-containing protein [Spirochaetes bacterium]|nr:DUF4178 domain-containing protein [Spirochaetota bacterium]
MTSMNCVSCGASLEIKNRFSKVFVCEYCGTHLRVKDGGFDIAGKHPKLADFPSIFNVGSTGTILGKPFTALGRMRYKYSNGHYDEWFIDFDGEKAWFTEDEGTFTLYTDLYEAVDIQDINTIRPGQNIMVGDKKVMVKEKGNAVVEGGEGELFFYVEPGSDVVYIDAIAEGKKISVEYTETEVEMFAGRPLLKRDILVN